MIESSRQPRKIREAKPIEFLGSTDPLAAYFQEIKKSKNLTLAEEKVLSTRIRNGDKRAVNLLVQANLKFVVAVCRNYQYQGLPMGDLINEGNLGLIRAAQRFDGNMDFKFISYAVWWIRQGILSALAEQSRVLNISAGRVGVIHKIGKVNQKLAQTLGRHPTPGELAAEMGLSEKEITESLQLATSPLSFSATAPGETTGTIEDCLKDDNGIDSDKDALDFLLGENLGEIIGTLEEREQFVLKMYYGVGTPISHTLEEIAVMLHLTRERIRQIKSRALDRLRHPTRMKRLACFRS